MVPFSATGFIALCTGVRKLFFWKKTTNWKLKTGAVALSRFFSVLILFLNRTGKVFFALPFRLPAWCSVQGDGEDGFALPTSELVHTLGEQSAQGVEHGGIEEVGDERFLIVGAWVDARLLENLLECER